LLSQLRGMRFTLARNEEYIIAPLSDQIVEVAVDLTGRHPLRGYDAVHLATAVILNAALFEAGLPSLLFVSADGVLCETAQGEGLPADNPNGH
jgi:predicted nucleic acid-binding protein